ncbi:MAG TPA: class I SAM-dependent methyltransferase, partial [Candidatus Baltobacteraceae bacterium]|nr:class I SAM-dependent methyltransferase [Candidatus Baltobacteraceae bacterium]
MGCGRGFLGRWLDAAGIGVRYAGVDRVEVALESARQHVRNGMMTLGDFRATDWQPEFDVVTAIEIAIDGSVGESIFDAAAAALRTGGMFALTLASLHGQNAGRLGTLLKSAKQRFDYADLVDWTQRVTPFAHRTYGWWVIAPWHPEIDE